MRTGRRPAPDTFDNSTAATLSLGEFGGGWEPIGIISHAGVRRPKARLAALQGPYEQLIASTGCLTPVMLKGGHIFELCAR